MIHKLHCKCGVVLHTVRGVVQSGNLLNILESRTKPYVKMLTLERYASRLKFNQIKLGTTESNRTSIDRQKLDQMSSKKAPNYH